MSKKFIYLSFFLTAIVIFTHTLSFALQWGILDDYKNGYKHYATYKLINNVPIKYYLSIERNNNNNKSLNEVEELKSSLEYKEYHALLETAINTWIIDTKKAIKNKGRTKEFNDIMPYLEKPIKLTQVYKEAEADLIIKFSDIIKVMDICGENAPGCFSPISKQLIIPDFKTDFHEDLSVAKQKDYVSTILVHEVGHFWGLTDQYFEDPQQDLEYSTNNRINKWSVMAASYSKHLSCDDVDGFINLIDLTVSKQNGEQFPDEIRTQKGWASFCNGKEGFAYTRYKKAKVLNKKDKKVNFCNIKYDKEGNLTEEKCAAPFNFYRNKKVLNKNTIVPQMIDKDFEYTYRYYKDKNNTFAIDVSILDKETKKTTKFTTKQKMSSNKRQWDLDSEEISYIIFHRNNCMFSDTKNRVLIVFDTNDDIYYKAYLVGINKKSKQGFLFKHGILGLIQTGKKEDWGYHDACSFEYDDKEVLRIVYSFITPKLNLKINENNKMVDFITRQYGITRDELIYGVKEACDDSLPELENQALSLCNYFRAVEKKLNE